MIHTVGIPSLVDNLKQHLHHNNNNVNDNNNKQQQLFNNINNTNNKNNESLCNTISTSGTKLHYHLCSNFPRRYISQMTNKLENFSHFIFTTFQNVCTHVSGRELVYQSFTTKHFFAIWYIMAPLRNYMNRYLSLRNKPIKISSLIYVPVP